MSIQYENENQNPCIIVNHRVKSDGNKKINLRRKKTFSSKALVEINKNIVDSDNKSTNENSNSLTDDLYEQKNTIENKENKKRVISCKRKINKMKTLKEKEIIINFPKIDEWPEEFEESSKKQNKTINSKSVDKKVSSFNPNYTGTNNYNNLDKNKNLNEEKNDELEIHPMIRMEIINWIFEKLGQLKNSKYFYLAVNIWDTFLLKSKKSYEKSKLYLFATTAILKSVRSDFSKIEYEVFLKKLLSDEKAKNYNSQYEIQLLLQSNLNDLVYITLEKYVEMHFIQMLLGFKKLTEADGILPIIKETSKYLCKLILHFSTLNKEETKFIAAGCVYAAFGIVEDAIKEKKSKISKILLKILDRWLNIYFKNNKVQKKDFDQLVGDIIEEYRFYQEMDFLKVKYLNKFCSLNFLNK